jgi:ribosome biogenesis protein ERB1
MGSKPYKSLKYHDKAIREVFFSKNYPLFASCSDEGSVNIFYSMVYNDLMQNALIVPVKVLKAHKPDKATNLGTLDVKFHPTQPWLFTCGADGEIKLWV